MFMILLNYSEKKAVRRGRKKKAGHYDKEQEDAMTWLETLVVDEFGEEMFLSD